MCKLYKGNMRAECDKYNYKYTVRNVLKHHQRGTHRADLRHQSHGARPLGSCPCWLFRPLKGGTQQQAALLTVGAAVGRAV